ncbi:Homeodomain-like protein, partial [Martensiomyces pterosporus]
MPSIVPHPQQVSPPPIKGKRKRASPQQLEVLNKVFATTSFPSTDMRNRLARELGMTPRTVQIWFQNKRQASR